VSVQVVLQLMSLLSPVVQVEEDAPQVRHYAADVGAAVSAHDCGMRLPAEAWNVEQTVGW
jgi:hypothetical protein